MRDEVAVVTGAGRGIGRAVAEALAREGYAVALVARTRSDIDDAVAGIQAAGGRALSLSGNVARNAQVKDIVYSVLQEFGRIDVLVNNAGISTQASFVDCDQDEWDSVVSTNLYGAVYFTRAVARHMITAGGGGRIVNVSSIHSYRGEPLSSHYDVSKAGLDQLTRTLAIELAPYGIRINSVAPGFVDTQMCVVNGVSELETDWFRQFYVERRKIPLARAAKPEEVAAAVLFLASEDSSYVTGHVLVVDGGLSVTF